MNIRRIIPDFFTAALISTVILASFLPCDGVMADIFHWLTNLAIGLLFFLHGAKLSSAAVREGLTNWRLHLTVFCCTFILFPVLGLLLKPLLFFMDQQTVMGIMFVCVLPSTVQSSIAFTSIAKGNVPAAICSASISSLLGIFITPLLSAFLIMPQSGVHISFDSIGTIILMMLMPFVLGQLLRKYIQSWIMAHRSVIRIVDQGSILLIVYTAFSAAVIQKLWSRLSWPDFIVLIVVCCVLLTAVLLLTSLVARLLKFNREDSITIIFCGSKKSLATGVPMLGVLFAGQNLGLLVLPIMVFHQIQLMVCAFLAPYFARSSKEKALTVK